jgi:hypothetical protein
MNREDLVDFFWESLNESMGPDWSVSDGAQRIVDDIEHKGRLDAVLAALSEQVPA